MTSLLASLAIATAIHHQEPGGFMSVHDQSHYWGIFGGQSFRILGTQDSRTGFGALYAYGRPDRRLSIHGIPAQLVYEGYIDTTHSGGAGGIGPSNDTAIGFNLYARYRYPVYSRHGLYFDIGFGAQYVSSTSKDLDLNLNTTPTLGAGFFIPSGASEYMFGLRLLHISNGGRKKPNDGQNQIYLTLMQRF